MMPRSFPFSVRKAMQAIAVLVDAEPAQQVSYYRLLKLLYVADREYFKETGRPIVGGRCVAMRASPLSSPTYDLIKGEHPDSPVWRQHFARNRRHLEMTNDPGNDELSKREIKKLHAVVKKFLDLDDDELGVISHDFPEYIANFKPNTSTPIPIEDLIDAVGLADSKEEILRDLKTQSGLAGIFGPTNQEYPRVRLHTGEEQ